MPRAMKVLNTEGNDHGKESEEGNMEKMVYLKTEPDEQDISHDEINRFNFYKKNVSMNALNKIMINNNKSGNNSFVKHDKKFQINYDNFIHGPNILNVSNSGLRNSLKNINSIKGIMVNKENNNIQNLSPSIKRKNFICENGWKLLDSSFICKKIDEFFSKKDGQIPYEYLSTILENLFIEEKIIRVNPKYMDMQKDINEKMRVIIVNWLVEVHYRFKLFPETLFLCINLLDRYLSIKNIQRNRLQLLGVACLLVACKYEEIFSPEIRDFVCILDKSYDKDDIIKMERELLLTLKFNITIASCLKFFEILSVGFKLTKKEFYFGRYLLENSLLDYKLNKYYPSLIASSCLYMALNIFKSEKDKLKDSEIFFKVINYKEEEVCDCAMDICFIADNIHNSTYQSIKKKFSSKNFCEVACVKII